MSSLVINTTLGSIRLALRPDAAPVTAEHISKLVKSNLFTNVKFYRSDFVIQTGLYGTSIQNPHPNLRLNETSSHTLLSNTRGTCAVAHHDVPDNGNSEFFINLQPNTHLDTAYGGYCVFAKIDERDDESFEVVDKIAKSVAGGQQVDVASMAIE